MGQIVSCSAGRGSQSQRLRFAIRDGDVQYFKVLVETKPALLRKSHFYKKYSPLHLASLYGQIDVLTFLLESGVDPHARTRSGKTPLMLACKGGKRRCVERLLEYGADVLAFEFSTGRTCLHYAARSSTFECVQKILDAAQSGPISSSWGFRRFVNVRDVNGAIPLHMAARAGQVRTVRLLLESGAVVSSVTATSSYGPGRGSTPLHCAARGGSLECVQELLAWGADRTQVDLMGYTPYGIAMYHKNFACAAILNPNAAEPLVWPSPWKFMSELEPETKIILEAALAAANDTRENSESRTTGGVSTLPVDKDANKSGKNEDEGTMEDPTETCGWGVQEVCCICFEQFCTIEVKDCGHQMCAPCTLALCCHNKPNPAVPFSPPPACPFCRGNIGRLILARPKQGKEVGKARSRRVRRSSWGSWSSRSLGSKLAGGSFRRGSGRVADME